MTNSKTCANVATLATSLVKRVIRVSTGQKNEGGCCDTMMLTCGVGDRFYTCFGETMVASSLGESMLRIAIPVVLLVWKGGCCSNIDGPYAVRGAPSVSLCLLANPEAASRKVFSVLVLE